MLYPFLFQRRVLEDEEDEAGACRGEPPSFYKEVKVLYDMDFWLSDSAE